MTRKPNMNSDSNTDSNSSSHSDFASRGGPCYFVALLSPLFGWIFQDPLMVSWIVSYFRAPLRKIYKLLLKMHLIRFFPTWLLECSPFVSSVRLLQFLRACFEHFLWQSNPQTKRYFKILWLSNIYFFLFCFLTFTSEALFTKSGHKLTTMPAECWHSKCFFFKFMRNSRSRSLVFY